MKQKCKSKLILTELEEYLKLEIWFDFKNDVYDEDKPLKWIEFSCYWVVLLIPKSSLS